MATRFNTVRRQMKMRVCYCSVFDECWVFDLRTLHPEPVAQCAKPEVAFVH